MSARDLARHGAQIAGLWALAVAQPLFEVLETGEAFVISAWRGGDVVLFAVVVAFVLPAVLLAVEWVVARVTGSPPELLHHLVLGGLVAVFAAYAVKKQADPAAGALIAVTAVAFGLATLAFQRFEPPRSFATLLAPAPFVFVALFLFNTPVRGIVLPADGADLSGPKPKTPVVMIVFDEFPTLSLMDSRGELDARTFPAFAGLARDGIWFRNATTVADFTTSAIPALLTGQSFERIRPASAAARPDNLLALLGRRGGAQGLEDGLTRLCPPDVCDGNAPPPLTERLTRPLGSLAKLSLATWLPYGVVRRLPEFNPVPLAATEDSFRRLVSAPGPAPAIKFVHVNFPHTPWNRLPSGRFYPLAPVVDDFVAGTQERLKVGFPTANPTSRWASDRRGVTHMLQRHLAQVAYADRLLGRTLAALRKTGLYDRALIVVTADHGISMRPGDESRQLDERNAVGVMFVPLFVKPPAPHRGRVSDRFVQSVDVVPTVADVLGISLPWKVDGHSALDERVPDRRVLAARNANTGERVELDARELVRRRRVEAAEQAALFAGAGPERIFRVGPHRSVIGRPVADLGRAPGPALAYTLDPGSPSFDVPPRSPFLPALIAGRITGPGAGDREVLVAVNGRIAGAAVIKRSGAEARFGALLDERWFRVGRNALALYAASPGPRGPRLTEIPAS